MIKFKQYMVKTRPRLYPECVHGKDFPRLAMKQDWPQNTPYQPRKEGAREDTPHRKTFNISYPLDYEERIAKVTKSAKKCKSLKFCFRDRACLMLGPTQDDIDVIKKEWQQVIYRHGATQKS